jgi:hypothetical protein
MNIYKSRSLGLQAASKSKNPASSGCTDFCVSPLSGLANVTVLKESC